MAQTDWLTLNDGLPVPGSVVTGVTAGITPPNGGGSFILGMNSLVAPTSPGSSVGFYVEKVDFNPMAKGGSIRGAIKRGTGGGKTGFSPFFFILADANSVNSMAYILGLENNDPSHIVLLKGYLNAGVPAADASNSLRISSESFDWDVWHHLRLDVVVNVSGDVVLKVFANDLDDNDVDAPVWEAVAGMDDFIDDVLQVNSGSAPLTSGYLGVAAHFIEITRRAYFDHIEALRQVSP